MGRGNNCNEIGIATIDINSPTLRLCQISDDAWYNGLCAKINIGQPHEIIMPSTVLTTFPTPKIVEFIRPRYSNIRLTSFDRRHFNEDTAMAQLNKFCAPKYMNDIRKMAAEHFALTSAAALMNYVQFVSRIKFANSSLKIEFESKFAAMSIGKFSII